MKISELKKKISNGELDSRLISLYGKDELITQKKRYLKLASVIPNDIAESQDWTIFSNPGRTELAGNHTDHNLGCVLAASVQLDTLAFACKRDDNVVELISEGYKPSTVDLSFLKKVNNEIGETTGLIRGIAKKYDELGLKYGGWTAYTCSSVPGGSGLSSSAAIEDLIGNIYNVFYNNGKIDSVTIAKVGQWAENNYFDKPCGLMDQVACAYGGIVAIDFKNPTNPKIESVKFDFQAVGYDLCVVNTGGSHANLTDEYAAIPIEMKSVAEIFDKPVLRDITINKLLSKITEIREKCGDRALLRAIHFINENERPKKMVELLKSKKIKDYLNMVQESGISSWTILQNCTSIKDIKYQGVTTALALTEQFLSSNKIDKKISGICRVHGGGFAGTIQAYIASELTKDYIKYIEKVFGKGSATIIKIRQEGTTKVI